MKNMNIIRWILAASVLLLVVLDQVVKQWARVYLLPVGRLPIIDGLIGFRYVTNAGAAFGIFQSGRWFFVVLTIIVIAVILVLEFKFPYTKRHMWIRVPMTLTLAGAIGNFIDRLLFGYVVDMFEFLFIDFPIFNVADILLVTGTFIYAFAALFILKDDPNEKERPAKNEC
ncbi:MAG: signal peptidase II [Defluviitaleaceae bacterium]|nr:signal peptidase II [Defluviitaleaceae bacterium]